ncbi:hypothetical protein RJ639_030488 [Escallonia herrerae]|uniref:Threonylcarbamoyl-AMP synthase n=1 Tax=Escallonia herrerae TaxID=1293975 RepID=A0AA89BMA8_9ASTE|nr:hypothetical protein RJ639_030488 [Escallonia herrerae]
MCTCLAVCISVVPRLGHVECSHQGFRGFRGGFGKKMAWNLEKCDPKLEFGSGLVRPATEEYAREAIDALKSGKVLAMPTDRCTVWLAMLEWTTSSIEAVHHIYEVKGREHTRPLAICIGNVWNIDRFAVTNHLPLGLLASLLPGPVTVVLKRGDSSILEKSLNPGLDSIGVRVPDCNFIRVIARGSGSALALTSANLSGNSSSVDIRDFENLWEHCAYVYDGRVLPLGRAGSTIVDLTNIGKYKILRSGSAKEEMVKILQRYSLSEGGTAA